MISALLFLNTRGEIVIQRYYRDDIVKTAPETFRQEVIAGKMTNLPIVHMDGTTFMYV